MRSAIFTTVLSFAVCASLSSVTGCAARTSDASAGTESAATTTTVETKVQALRDLLNKETSAPLAHTKTVRTSSDEPEAMLREYLAEVHTRTATSSFRFAADPSQVDTGHVYGTLSTAGRALDIINEAQGFEGQPWKHSDEASALLDAIVNAGAQLGYDGAGRSDNGSTEVLLLVIDTNAKKVYNVETYPLED
jgi:hypothetical protein